MAASLDDVVSVLRASNQNMSQLIQTISGLFPRTFGSFTMAASASKVVTDANVIASSMILLSPTNAAAGTLMGGTKSLYVTAAAGSFTVTTASGVAAAGTETFKYFVFTPV